MRVTFSVRKEIKCCFINKSFNLEITQWNESYEPEVPDLTREELFEVFV